MAGDSVAESGLYDASQAAKLVSHVTARLPCSPKAKNISAGCARQKGNGWRFSEILGRDPLQLCASANFPKPTGY
jgi:hypothetical protein